MPRLKKNLWDGGWKLELITEASGAVTKGRDC